MPLTQGAPMTPAPAELQRDLADAARWRDEVAREWRRLGGATGADGTDTKGTDTKGTDTKGTDTKGTDTKGTDTKVWGLLAAVLQAVRDCLPLEAAASLGNQLPVPVRGVYYARWHPAPVVRAPRCRAAFLAGIGARLTGRLLISMEEAERAAVAVLRVVDRRITRRLSEEIRHGLPRDVRLLLPEAPPGEVADGPGRVSMGAAVQEKSQAAASMGLRT